jgi:endonuclease/exonuclease/phosphatase (EEP) superfamily protein YafD
MSYNLLGWNQHTAQIVAALRASGADLIALQELNPEVGAAIARDLALEYPYQALELRYGVAGMGVISRYPLHAPDRQLPGGHWIGPPQLLSVAFGDQIVDLANIHAVSFGNCTLAEIEGSLRERERQAQLVANLAHAGARPLIVMGDFNMTERSVAYALLTAALTDAWRAGGHGLGHTFPGAAGAHSSRPSVLGIPVPMWLIRIDYVFHSRHWRTLSARIGPWDGGSDHRPVLATLELQQPTPIRE